MRHHPWARDFLRLLRSEPGGGTRARVFVRLVEAFGDEEGLPRLAGLRRLERGHFDDRLPPEWCPVFRDVLRRWIGYRLDREFGEGPLPLSARWWVSPLSSLRGRAPARVRTLSVPLLPLIAVVFVTGLLLVPPVVDASLEAERFDELRLEMADRRIELARTAEAVDRHLPVRDAASLEPLIDAWPAYAAARERALMARARLAELAQRGETSARGPAP